MINANELKIGNWIYIDNGKRPKYAYDITAHDIEEIDGCGEDSFPIPLTPEILQACGFEATSKGFWGHPNWYNMSLKYNKTYQLRCAYTEVVATNIDYLHQLQNLYFSLTGQELEVNSMALNWTPM